MYTFKCEICKQFDQTIVRANAGGGVCNGCNYRVPVFAETSAQRAIVRQCASYADWKRAVNHRLALRSLVKRAEYWTALASAFNRLKTEYLDRLKTIAA